MTKSDQKIELNAEKREILGSGVKKLKDLKKAFKTAGESTLVYVNVNSQTYPTIIHDVSKDALTDEILHADFYKVRLDEKIKTKVPVVFVGESPAVKDLGGIFVRNVNELEVEALPQNLPHEITVDISSLKNFGDQVLVKNIDLGAKVKVEADAETIVATVQEPMSEEELKASLETPTTGVEEVEVIKKEKPEEVAEEVAEAPTIQEK